MTSTPMTRSVRRRARPREGRGSAESPASSPSSGSGGRLKLTATRYRWHLSRHVPTCHVRSTGRHTSGDAPPRGVATGPSDDNGRMTGDSQPLVAVLREVEEFVAEGGWDQPARLFALVPTGELLAREPRLVGVVAGDDADGLTPVEQEELPEYATLEELLAGLAW